MSNTQTPQVKSTTERVSSPNKTLVLIDGHALAYRMHFALEMTQMKTSQQLCTWAVYGFFNALFSLLQTTKPDAIAVSFDVSRVTFRHELYEQYKAHREKMPDELREQMALIKEGVRLLGIPIYELEGYEADDVIGTLAERASGEGWTVKILTGDQDAFQLVKDASKESAGAVQVLIPSRIQKEGLRVFDRAKVFEKLGVYPEQVTDYKGFRGDTSDNIPGIPGVGEKTAVKLLTEYPSLEEVYAHLDKMPKNKLLEKLVTHQEQARLSKQLATIDRHVPIEVNFEDCHLVIPDLQALVTFLEKCEFRNFIRQAPVILAPFLTEDGHHEELHQVLNGNQNQQVSGNLSRSLPPMPHPAGETSSKAISSPTDDFSSLEADSSQQVTGTVLHPVSEIKPMLSVPHRVITSQTDLDAWIVQLREIGVFSLDIETTGLDVFTADLVGIAMSVAKGFKRITRPAVNILKLKDYPAQVDSLALHQDADALREIETVYIPVGHTGPDNEGIRQLPLNSVLEALKPLLVDPSVTKIVHNAKFELNFFEQLGISWQGLVFDTMIASYVHNPENRHGLKSLGFQHFHYMMQEIKSLIGSGKSEIPFSQVPLDQAAGYAACDAYVTLELAHWFSSQFNFDQWTLFDEIEMPLAWVLTRIERTGVSLDTAYLKQLSDELDVKLRTVEAEIYQLAEVEFNINSPKQVGEVLFDKLGIAPLKKTKGKTGYSTDVKVLEQLSGKHPVVDKILEYRQFFKLKSTYVDALPELINPKTSRVHTSFNQTVTATGRLSSSNPNLQNIPIRTELGRQIRNAFVPKEKTGWKLLSADYSQIELRLLAHFSEDPHLVRAFNQGEDIHQATASLVFGVPMDKVTKEMRYKAKTVNFGVVYGQSAHGLSQQLKIPRAEAAEFIDRYFFKYKKVKEYIEAVKAEAHLTGQVRTIGGRVRNLQEGLNNSVRSIREFSERAAFNTPLQGSAADLMKVAMIRLARQLEKQPLKSRMILQVHDELVLEAPDREIDIVTQLVREAMELDQPLRVPLVVDISVGESWLES